MPSQIEEQLGEIGLTPHKDEKKRISRHGRDDRKPVLILQHGQAEGAASQRAGKLGRRSDERRDMCGQAVGVEPRFDRAVNQQPVASEHNDRVDAVSAPKGTHQIANRGHTDELLLGEKTRPDTRRSSFLRQHRVVRLVIVRVRRQDIALSRWLRRAGNACSDSVCSVSYRVCPCCLSRSFQRRPLLLKITESWRAMVGVLCLMTVSACSDDDPFRASATVPNVTTGISLASFSTGTVAPSAIDLLNLRAVRPEVTSTGQVNFQIAVDVDAGGQIRLLPVLSLLSPPGGAISVGLGRSVADFDDLARAPTGGFVADSAVTTRVGETWLVQLQSGTCVNRDPLYGKLVVDEVNTSTKRVFVRLILNRNCGYRDLTLGLPRN